MTDVIRRSTVPVRLLFADDGGYHHETVHLPGSALEGYDRLIDALREDPDVLAGLYVDVHRLCAAWVVDEADGGGDAAEASAAGAPVPGS